MHFALNFSFSSNHFIDFSLVIVIVVYSHKQTENNWFSFFRYFRFASLLNYRLLIAWILKLFYII